MELLLSIYGVIVLAENAKSFVSDVNYRAHSEVLLIIAMI